MDKYGRSEINHIKNSIKSIINVLTPSSFTEEKESKDLDIFTGENNPSNIETSWGPYIKPEDEMVTARLLNGHYRLTDKTKTGVMIDYDLIPDIYFTKIEIIPRSTHVFRTRYLYITLVKNGKEIFRSEPGQLIMNFERILVDKFKLCFDVELGDDPHVNFEYIKFLYVTRKPPGEDYEIERSKQIPMKNAIKHIINILTVPSFTGEKECKDLEIFKGPNVYSNIRSSRGTFIDPKNEMSTVFRRGGNYKLVDKTKTGFLINYDMFPDIYFTKIEIISETAYIERTKYLYIILGKNGKEIFRSEPGKLIIPFEKFTADKFKLCFDDEDTHTSFTYVKILYMTLKPLGEDRTYLIDFKKFL